MSTKDRTLYNIHGAGSAAQVCWCFFCIGPCLREQGHEWLFPAILSVLFAAILALCAYQLNRL